MFKILYTGFGEFINGLKSSYAASSSRPAEFIELKEQVDSEAQKVYFESHLLLIGPFSASALRLAQNANRYNPMLSILILPFQNQLVKIKQSIQFSPKTGINITCLPFSGDNSIIPVIENAAVKTQQRQSFKRIKQKVGTSLVPAPLHKLPVDDLKIFLERLPFGTIMYNRFGELVNANTFAKEALGAYLSEKEEHMKLLSRNVRSNGPQVLELNGRSFELTVVTFNHDPEQKYDILLFTDITEKARATSQLKEKMAELEVANQELEQFVNVVSHDFKTPITSISLLSQLLLRGNVNEEKKDEFIQKIHQQSHLLTDLLQGLVLLIDAKKAQAEKLQLLKFEDELQFILEQYRDLIEECEAEIRSDFSQAETICYLEAHLKSLISNLLSNAIKYRNIDKKLEVVITTRKEGNFVVLTVKDNGIGIDLSKNLDKLFTPYKRFTNQASGTGLGLSLIKRMVERNGGYIEVSSKVNEGTEFIVFLKEYQA